MSRFLGGTRPRDFIALCTTPELASELTLQPVRRYRFASSPDGSRQRGLTRRALQHQVRAAASLCRRSCQASISWSTVAAVSSIERRVTSITGQPRYSIILRFSYTMR
jgi:hypothetical protein